MGENKRTKRINTNSSLKIVLLGSIPKGDNVRKSWKDWKTEYFKIIFHELPHATFLHGDLITDDVGPEIVVGHDLWLIQHADLAIVNAPSKIGAGTAQEMVLAKAFHKPVISIIPKDTHHRKSNIVFGGTIVEDWIHPFLYIASDFIAEDIDEAARWISQYVRNKDQITIKDISVFTKTIDTFETDLSKVYEEYKKRGW